MVTKVVIDVLSSVIDCIFAADAQRMDRKGISV